MSFPVKWLAVAVVAEGLALIPGQASTNQAVFTFLQGDDITWHAEQGGSGKGRYPREGEIFQGRDRLVTGPDGKSELCMTQETVVRVGPNSLFYFQPQKRWLSLKEGSLLLQKMPAAGEWTVESGGWVAAVAGSSLYASQPTEGPSILGVLETSSFQGIRVSTRQGTGNWSLSSARMLWSEAPGEPAEILPFDPSMVWKYSVIGSNLPGTTWPECAGKIPVLSPPRSTLDWTYHPEMYEGYPATLGKRSDALLRVDRYLLPAAYGTEEEAQNLVRNQTGFSTITDPEGNHPLSVALDVNRLDLVKVFLPAFKLDAYQNRGREKFPASFLAKSPLPRAVLMLPPDRFKEFLSLGPWTRREILDAYAVGANFALLGGSKPAGGYYFDVAANLIELAVHQKTLATEENEALVESCILPALLAIPGTAPLLADLKFMRSRHDLRLGAGSSQKVSGKAGIRQPNSAAACTFFYNPSFALQDNFDAYNQARIIRREILPQTTVFFTNQQPSPSSVFLSQILDTVCSPAAGMGSSMPLSQGLTWAEWLHAPDVSPRPLTRPPAPPSFSSSPDPWPHQLKSSAKIWQDWTELHYPGTSYWIAGGRLLVPRDAKTLIAESSPDRNGNFAISVREPYPAVFYLAGFYPLILEYGQKHAGRFGWYGDLKPVPVPAKERAKIRGRILWPTENSESRAGSSVTLQLRDSAAFSRSTTSWSQQVATAEVASDGFFEFSNLAPLPYELMVHVPGWCVHREYSYPGREQTVHLDTIRLEKAPILSFRHILRARRIGQAWTTSPSVEHESVICDNENSLTFSKLPADFARELQHRLRLHLKTQDQRVSAVSMYNQTLAEVGNLQVRGAESFGKIPPGLMTQIKTNFASTRSISFRKGRTYLQKGENQGIQWEWLIEVD